MTRTAATLSPPAGGERVAVPVRARPRLRRLVPLAAVVLVAAVLQGLPQIWLDLANTAMIAAIGALALNLVMGHAGMVSIGNAAFLAVGGVGAAEGALYLHQGAAVSVLIGAVVAGVAGLVVALPSFRIAGLYLAIGTLSFHFIVLYFVQRLQTRQVGSSAYLLPLATFGPVSVTTLNQWAYALLAILCLVLLGYRTLLTRKPGRVWRAIREHPLMAEMSGVPIGRYRLIAAVVSSFLIGLAGGLQGYYLTTVTYESYTLDVAVLYIAIVVLGGMGSLYGPIVGAVLFTVLARLLQDGVKAVGLSGVVDSAHLFLVQGTLVGLVLAAVLIFEPRGLAALFRRAGHALAAVVTRRRTKVPS